MLRMFTLMTLLKELSKDVNKPIRREHSKFKASYRDWLVTMNGGRKPENSNGERLRPLIQMKHQRVKGKKRLILNNFTKLKHRSDVTLSILWTCIR